MMEPGEKELMEYESRARNITQRGKDIVQVLENWLCIILLFLLNFVGLTPYWNAEISAAMNYSSFCFNDLLNFLH
jgi:hypothetical protein